MLSTAAFLLTPPEMIGCCFHGLFVREIVLCCIWVVGLGDVTFSPPEPVVLACPFRVHCVCGHKQLVGLLGSLTVGDEEIRFISSDEQAMGLRHMVTYVVGNGCERRNSDLNSIRLLL